MPRRNFLSLLAMALGICAAHRSGAGALVRPLKRRRPQEWARKLIYVVDDEASLTELYALVLESAGYQAQTFNDRVEALEAFWAAARKPDLLITDFVGYPISADLLMCGCRTSEPDLKILMASACDRSCLEECAVKPDGFMQKPFSLEGLLAEVRALV